MQAPDKEMSSRFATPRRRLPLGSFHSTSTRSAHSIRGSMRLSIIVPIRAPSAKTDLYLNTSVLHLHCYHVGAEFRNGSIHYSPPGTHTVPICSLRAGRLHLSCSADRLRRLSPLAERFGFLRPCAASRLRLPGRRFRRPRRGASLRQ